MVTLAEKFAKNKQPQTLAEKFAPKVQETPRTTGGVVSPTFTSRPGENPLIAGAKAVGNIPSSAFGLGKGLFEAVKSPVETVKAVGGVLGGAGSKILESTVGKGVEAITGKPVQKADTQAFDMFGQVLKERYGSLEALQKTATEDPIGFGADLLSVIEGGAGLVGKTPQLTRGLSRTAQVVTKPTGKALETAGGAIKSTTQFGLSQATGLNPETIRELVRNPQKFKNIDPEIRVQTAQQVAEALDTRLAELSDVGKGYEAIRQFEVPVTIPEDTVSKVLNKYGVKLDENFNIVTSPESRPLSATDRNALQDFINNYGRETELTSNSFLNTREALSNLSKFEQGKTNLPVQISRDLRAAYDALGKQQIPGLANLDTVYAPERQLLGQLKKDIFDARGELKDTAISKIANLTGKGKEQVLERVKQIVPDIEERVRLIKAVEDIERASGLKTATYVRSGIVGGGALTGNIPAIIGAIISQPEIAAPLLRGAGYVGQKALPILQAIKDFANDVNNFTVPKPVVDYAKNPKLGMSIEDVTKTTGKVDDTLLQEAKKYKSADVVQSWSKLQKENPDLFNKGILRKSLKPQDYKGVIPENVHDIQGKWQNYGEFDEITADKIYKRIESGAFKGEYEDKFGNPIHDKNGRILQDTYDESTGQWVKPTVSNKELRNELLDVFSTKEGKQYLDEVVKALPKNSDGTITAYRVGKIGDGGVQSYTLSEGMAKTFSNQGTSVLPAGTPGLPKAGYTDFGSLPTNIVKIDPKGIQAWSPYDAEILVESKYVKKIK